MSALPMPRSIGATAFDVAVICDTLCRLACQPKYFRHRKALNEMLAEPVTSCDNIMELVGCDPDTLPVLDALILREMPKVRLEIFEDFADRLKKKDPVLMELIKQFPIG